MRRQILIWQHNSVNYSRRKHISQINRSPMNRLDTLAWFRTSSLGIFHIRHEITDTWNNRRKSECLIKLCNLPRGLLVKSLVAMFEQFRHKLDRLGFESCSRKCPLGFHCKWSVVWEAIRTLRLWDIEWIWQQHWLGYCLNVIDCNWVIVIDLFNF